MIPMIKIEMVRMQGVCETIKTAKHVLPFSRNVGDPSLRNIKTCTFADKKVNVDGVIRIGHNILTYI